MIPNELIFFLHVCAITVSVIGAAYLGKRALTGLVMLFIVLANLFVTQTITIFGCVATSSDVFTIGCGFAVLMLQERYGKSAAQRAIVISFFGVMVTLVLAQLHLWYLPAQTDVARSAFNVILSNTPRIFGASIFSYVVSEYANVSLYAQLTKKLTQAPHLVLMYLSLACSSFIDTLMFSFLGLYGVISPLSSIIFVSYIIKLVTIGLTAGFGRVLGTWFLRNK